jgi:hypothetical protein
MNAHARTKGRCEDTRDGFFDELDRVFDQVPRYHVQILLGYFIAKVGGQDIFKPTIENESLR